MNSWSIAAIAAYLIWWAIAPGALAILLRRGRDREIPGGKPAALETAVAVAFNGLVAALLGGEILPRTLAMEGLHPSVPWLIALPFLPYGLAGFAYLRRKVKPKRTAIGRAIAVYAFSTAGHLACVTLLLAYLLAVSRLKQ